ncbi:MAG TPA: tetratricopeptide repeat protein, partial [bacterium]|nr:tetratricopeptide repeat protein [bacterium]
MQAKRDGGPVLTAEARKIVTVVFADLVSSTGLTEQLDPEEAREVVGTFYDMVRNVVERTGGTVANLLGDAVLAIFGFPVTHEDDPERAVRAGLDIRDELPTLNRHLQTKYGVRLETRVGVNTGEVVAASGSTFDRDFLISDAVTTAARLQQTVSPGVVVVGERTHRLTHDVIDYRECPPMEVKGKATPLRVWEAVGMLPERPEVRRIAAPLVGRHAEMGLLRTLYQRSCDEAIVHLVTVLGQAGVGKSRLLREFLAEVRDLDPRPLVLRGRSVAFGGQIGYHALRDILHGQAGIMNTDPSEVVRAKLVAWLRERLPRHEALLDGLLLTLTTEGAAPSDPERLRRKLFEAWEGLVLALAANQPVILAIEDIQWADDGVLDLAEAIGTDIDSARLFVICVGRPELREHRPGWGGGVRDATTLDLKPLRPREAEALVAQLSSQGLSSDLQKEIAERAGGNPLFAEELVHMLSEASAPGTAIPDTVQAVLTARIDRLSQAERKVLQAGSVLGRTFWPGAVAPLSGLSVDETIGAIEGLIRKEMVLLRPQSSIESEHEYTFRHILTRDVAYGMLPRSQRQRAHGEAGRWLETRLGERVEEVVEILAEHFRAAGDDTRAARYLHRAADKARRLYANTDAIRLYTQALDVAPKAAVPHDEIARLHRGRGGVYQLRGEYALALSDFEAGLTAAQQAGDRALEAALEELIGLIYHRQLRLSDAEPHFRRAAEAAREANDRLVLGLSLIDLANVAWDRGRVAPDDPSIVEGIQLLRETGNLSVLARGLNLLCMAHFSNGNGAEAIAAAKEALDAARGAGDKSRQATSLSYLSVVMAFWGRFREAIQYGQEAIAIAEEIGDKRRIAFATSFMAQAQLSLGDWGEAIRRLEQALPLLREYAVIHLPYALLNLAMLYTEFGDVVRAKPLLVEASTVELPHPTWRTVALVAQLSLAQLVGDRETLRRSLDGILKSPVGIFVADDGIFVLPVGKALLAEERFDELRRFLDAVKPNVEQFGAP